MKLVNLIPAFIFMSVMGCTQPDSAKHHETNVPTPIDTGEYISFTINGDSFNNEFVKIETGLRKSVSARLEGNDFFINLSLNIKDTTPNSSATRCYFAIYGNQQKVKAGSYPIGLQSARIDIYLPDFKGKYNPVGQVGLLTITHFPESTADYLTATFSGQFHNFNDTLKVFTLTNGKIRVRRTK